MQLDKECMAWSQSNWTIAPSDPDKLADYAAKLNLLNKTEWESEERISACDCAMYLLVLEKIDETDAQRVYDSESCHDWANNQAQQLGISSPG